MQNNPIRYSDPTGHVIEEPNDLADYFCDDPKYCKNGDFKLDPLDLRTGGSPDNDDIPIWSSRDLLKNDQVGDTLAGYSTKLQHGATFFSGLGGMSEVGFTTVGLLGGGAALSWLDGFFPIADVTGGLAGGLVGWEVGHGIHVVFTNPIESGLSNLSAALSYGSDLFYGNSRIDVYNDNVTVVVGQPSATSAALAFLGNLSSTGITDSAIDTIGSLYSEGKLGGVFDLFGITGKSVSIPPIIPFPVTSGFNLQFGG